LFWFNGQFISGKKLEIESDDPALLYGASVFTTMRVYHGSLENALTSWLAHCDRLSGAIEFFEWQTPDWHQVQQGVKALLPQYDVIRIAIFPDGRELILGRDLPSDLPLRQSQGIAALVVEDSSSQRAFPFYKTGNYLTCQSALNRANQSGAQEAILSDRQGNWLETCTGNLWGWRDGQWWTPRLNEGILPGIRRNQLITWLSQQNLPVNEVVWEPSFIAGLETVVYTNCVVEVVPLHTIFSQQKYRAYRVDSRALAQLRRFFAD
jgi:4-amino-4-deoxychorismate lyase